MNRVPLGEATESQCHAFRARLRDALTVPDGAALLVVRDAESLQHHVEAVNAPASWVEQARAEAPRLWQHVLRSEHRPADLGRESEPAAHSEKLPDRLSLRESSRSSLVR